MNEQRVGTEYIGVGVGIAVARTVSNGDLELLFMRRGPKTRNYCGKWEFPGGKIEHGELSREAAVRELEEETGLVDFFIDEEPFAFTEVYDTEIGHHWFNVCYHAALISGEAVIVEPEKCSGMVWVDPRIAIMNLDLTIFCERFARKFIERELKRVL